MEPYEIKPLTTEDQPEVVEHLANFYYRHEPMAKSIDLIGNDPERARRFGAHGSKDIPDNNSFKAVTLSGKIIGVSLNTIVKRNEVKKLSYSADDPKGKILLTIITKVEEETDLFGKYPDVDEYLKIRILSVDSSYTGRGIGEALIEKSRDLAKEKGLKLILVICSSHFTARATKKLGFKPIQSIKYADYKDNGKVVFNTEKPHTEIVVTVKEITS